MFLELGPRHVSLEAPSLICCCERPPIPGLIYEASEKIAAEADGNHLHSSDEEGPRETPKDSDTEEEDPAATTSHSFPALNELSLPCGKLYQQEVLHVLIHYGSSIGLLGMRNTLKGSTQTYNIRASPHLTGSWMQVSP